MADEKKYLDKTGLTNLVGKIKSELSKKANTEDVQPKGEYATLVDGTVPASQLPSYVDDVVEFSGFTLGEVSAKAMSSTKTSQDLLCRVQYVAKNNVFVFYDGKDFYSNWGDANTWGTPTTGTFTGMFTTGGRQPESGKIYVDTTTGKTYRWSGSSLVEISASLALGETSETAFAGDRGVAVEKSLETVKSELSKKANTEDVQPKGEYATLVDGTVPASQLPSYVDDVVEFSGFTLGEVSAKAMSSTKTSQDLLCRVQYVAKNNVFVFYDGKDFYSNWGDANTWGTPTTGTFTGMFTTGGRQPESGKIYVDTTTGKTYRWSGSSLVEISASLALGETSETAFAGDRGVAVEKSLETVKSELSKKANAEDVESLSNDVKVNTASLEAKSVTSISTKMVGDVLNIVATKINGDEATSYVRPATTGTTGLMSAEDKNKLDNTIFEEDKRQIAEKSRVETETSRVTAESGRVTAENARVAAENSRVSAEQTREQSFTAKVGEVDTAIKNCNTATEGAEKVDATITEANVLQVTDRNGTQKTLNLDAVAKANSVAEDVNRIKESMGAYSDRPDITLTAKENNVAISADGVKVSKSGWAIAEFTAELGNIYLFNPGETSADVCVFAEYIDKQETRAIDYAYTYDESGRVLTAKATYNGKTYTYSYDYSSSITAITDQDGNSVSSLPSVYTTTVGAYQPMTILNANAELPEDGYCRFVSNFTTASAIKIVVSYKVASADLTMKVVRDGSTANMCSQLAKINKKVDEVSEKVPKMWIRIVNNEGVYIKKDVVSLNFDKNLKKCDIHYNGLAPIKSILFCQCLKLTDLDVSCLDTSAVTSLSYAFWNCQNLKTPDFSGWNTSNVKSMQRMFYGCPFDSPDVNSWDTGKVTDMSYAFVSNKGKVDLSAWNTSNVENMTGVFWNANYTVINVSGWDTSKVAKMWGIFLNQTITTLTFGENFGKMKDACGTLDLSSLSAWNNDSVKSLLTLYDRKANGMGVITIKLHANAKAVLGEDGIEQLTAKGYTIA